MKIHLICAARPNFMKVAPLYHALKKEAWADPIIVHTGQHYDLNLSDAIFRDLALPKPDIHLGIGSGTHAEQTGKVMIAYEKVLMEEKPDLVIVVGDVNSTMACTIAASKVQYAQPNELNKPNEPNKPNKPLIAHLEAGLRSYDRTMPEEINRILTDSLADILWTPSQDADENLTKEGVGKDKIHFVGNIMIDSLEMLRGAIERQAVYQTFNLKPRQYGLVTLHRPSNVDSPESLKDLCDRLVRISGRIPLVFPVHPRTMKNLASQGLLAALKEAPGLLLPEPLSYIPFMNMVFNCRLVITDSGGIQEETTYLGIPCLTLRPNTERPVTITHGTNQLCNTDELEEKVKAILSGYNKKAGRIKFWDGQTASRIVTHLKSMIV